MFLTWSLITGSMKSCFSYVTVGVWQEMKFRYAHTHKKIYIYIYYFPLFSFLSFFFLIQLTTFLFPFYSFIHSFIHSFIRSIDEGWGGSRDGPRSLVVLLVGTMYIYKNRQITRPIDNFTTYDYFLVRVTSFFSSFFFHRSL